MVNQQSPTGINSNTQQSNNNNTNVPDSVLRSTFAVPSDPSSSTRNNETLRSRSADSRPINTNPTTSNIDDDESDWIDLPSMDIPMPPQQLPPPSMPMPMMPMPRIRGPAIIRKFFREKKSSRTSFFIYFRINRSKFTMCITLFYSNTSSTI
jgi:hypothetical protein